LNRSTQRSRRRKSIARNAKFAAAERIRGTASRKQTEFNAKAQSGKGASKNFEQEHAEIAEKAKLCRKCTIRRRKEDSRRTWAWFS